MAAQYFGKRKVIAGKLRYSSSDMVGSLLINAVKYLGKDMINSGKLGYSTCKRSLMAKKLVKGKVI